MPIRQMLCDSVSIIILLAVVKKIIYLEIKIPKNLSNKIKKIKKQVSKNGKN